MNQLYPWQQSVWDLIRNKVTTNSHALILNGRKGVGQFEFAHFLAKSLLCEKTIQAQFACGSCMSCKWFEQGIHPNFLRLEPEALAESDTEANQAPGDLKPHSEDKNAKKKLSQMITIDQIRSLDQFLYLSGHQSGQKIILIHPADCMNLSAANAMLKKIEEPPPQVLFLLVTDRLQSLLSTVVSRCMRITLPQPDKTSVQHWLHQEGIETSHIDPSWLGSSPQQIKHYLETGYFEYQLEWIEKISTPKLLNPISLADKFQKLELSVIVSWLQKWCYDLVSFQMLGIIHYHRHHEEAIKTIVAENDLKQLIYFWKQLIQFQQWSNHSLNARLFIEEILFTYKKIFSTIQPDRKC